MKHTLLYYIIAAALTLGVRGTAFAQADNEILYSLGEAEMEYGTGGRNAETYDVALRIADPVLVGLQVKAVRISFAQTENVSGAYAWLTRELPAIKSSKAGEPDICKKAFDVSADDVEVVFDEPYTITDEGVYVGYSFDVAKVTGDAVRPVKTTRYTSPDGFYIHTTKIYRTAWRSLYPNAGQLAIQVVLGGDKVMHHAASPVSAPELNLKTGQSWWSGFELVNHGNRGISRVEYTVEVDGQTYTNEETVNVPNIFGRYTEVPFEIPALSEKGAYPYTITVVKINGEPNEDPSPVISGVCNVYNTLPKHRSVLEEYTGTWCGYCPRGFVGLEEMNRLYPDDFIGVSYHNSDPMEITSQFPNTVSGYPDAWLDRVAQTDAFCGDSQYGTFGIDQAWLKACSVFAPVAVEVESRWADDETLEATAYVTFPLEHAECPYEVGFMLTQDGMTGTESGWTQSNYYSGEEGWPESMDEFTQGGSKVSGLVFNDVLVARSGIAGIQGSLTAPIVADVAQQCSYSFKMSDVVNTSKENIVQDKEKLRIIALVIDTRDGSIVNANKAMAGQSSLTTGIARPALSQDEVVSRVDYYDLQGRRTVKPSQGRLYLKTETLNNGQVRTTKVRM